MGAEVTPENKPVQATTTRQEDITTAGQRRINLIWEITQGVVAIMITGAIIYLAKEKIENKVLEYAFVAIITMYYVRTNHSLIGGTGSKRMGESRGVILFLFVSGVALAGLIIGLP